MRNTHDGAKKEGGDGSVFRVVRALGYQHSESGMHWRCTHVGKQDILDLAILEQAFVKMGNLLSVQSFENGYIPNITRLEITPRYSNALPSKHS